MGYPAKQKVIIIIIWSRLSHRITKFFFLALKTSASLSVPSLTNNTSIQPKLRISQPGDIYEKEAERIAKQIINTSDPPPSSNNPRTQSKASKENLIPIELDDSFSSLQRSTHVQDSLPENSPILDKAICPPGESLDSKT